MLIRFVRPVRLLTRRMGFDLLPLTLFVFPVAAPVLWLLLLRAAGMDGHP